MDYAYPADDNDATFTAADAADEDAWAADIARFDSIMTEFRELICVSDDGKFDQSVSGENQAKWSTLISNINTHNAFHGGQILLLRKLQGSWDSAKGVS